ncbi:hypothetical protein GCM10023206_07340 [Acinetobacter puyangensis]|uniref:Helix-turn-helix n=1 Tax=Acinetobacter puyangensis TaxID=1096779 RepID=A0A240E6J2_9GAMM|nr:helix-turn-helix transcriptional regulator [Acinetobacter puyangensis]SNX44186.1 Helix-turn-helix [Acinetobacter puyangensis]
MDIAAICLKLGCNQTELALKLGVEKSLISMWKTGRIEVSLSRQYQIRDLLDGKEPIKKSN